jgi:Na+/H+-dicarboxylate symporter
MREKISIMLRSPILYLCVIVLGIASGLSGLEFLHSLGFWITQIFIRLFKCISLPIISLSIIVAISSYKANTGMNIVWRKTMVYTVGTTLLAAFVSFFLYKIIHPSLINEQVSQGFTFQPATSYFQHIENLIPNSILTPFLKNQVISVLIISLSVGIATRFIEDAESQQTIVKFFQGAHSVFMVITRFIINIIPLGLFGFISTTLFEMRSGMFLKGLGEYLAIVVLANLVQGIIVLPILLKIHKISPVHMFKVMFKTLSFAFFAKSSVATLPLAMTTVEKKLHVKPEISRFVLPLCTTINMNGCAAFIFTTVIYLMQNNGTEVTSLSMLAWVFIATIAAIGNAGIPMGCFFLSASLLASMNVPIALMGIILPFYSLIDMLETALNVWSDVCVVKIVAQSTN